jgi:hypothetical protein
MQVRSFAAAPTCSILMMNVAMTSQSSIYFLFQTAPSLGFWPQNIHYYFLLCSKNLLFSLSLFAVNIGFAQCMHLLASSLFQETDALARSARHSFLLTLRTKYCIPLEPIPVSAHYDLIAAAGQWRGSLGFPAVRHAQGVLVT